MPAATLTALNQKGGVGKTSTTFHLAGTLAREGHRVLLIDADPQSSLTQGFLGPDATRVLSRHATVAALFGDDLAPTPARLIRPTAYDGISLVPGSRLLAEFNVPIPTRAPRDQQRALSSFVARARPDFDLILIDVPPNLHLCSFAALAASDGLFVPLQAEDFGAQGIADVLDSVELVQAGINPALRVLGFLLTMHNTRLAIHKAYEAKLRELYLGQVFEATVPYAADLKEAVANRIPISHYKGKGASARAFKTLAAEMIARATSPAAEGSERGAA